MKSNGAGGEQTIWTPIAVAIGAGWGWYICAKKDELIKAGRQAGGRGKAAKEWLMSDEVFVDLSFDDLHCILSLAFHGKLLLI